MFTWIINFGSESTEAEEEVGGRGSFAYKFCFAADAEDLCGTISLRVVEEGENGSQWRRNLTYPILKTWHLGDT